MYIHGSKENTEKKSDEKETFFQSRAVCSYTFPRTEQFNNHLIFKYTWWTVQLSFSFLLWSCCFFLLLFRDCHFENTVWSMHQIMSRYYKVFEHIDFFFTDYRKPGSLVEKISLSGHQILLHGHKINNSFLGVCNAWEWDN